MLARRRGHIITTGSIAGMASLPYMAVYAASKAANVLFNLTRQTELQNTGAHATAVNPGVTKGMASGTVSICRATRPSERRQPWTSPKRWSRP